MKALFSGREYTTIQWPCRYHCTCMATVWYLTDSTINKRLECGPMPNLMVALSNTGGALCSTPQSLADAHY